MSSPPRWAWRCVPAWCCSPRSSSASVGRASVLTRVHCPPQAFDIMLRPGGIVGTDITRVFNDYDKTPVIG